MASFLACEMPGFSARASEITATPAASAKKQGKVSAQQVLANASDRLRQAGGIVTQYQVSGASGKGVVAGTLKVSGQKFAIIDNLVSTWYDGSSQWNYNHNSGECTVSTPTMEEISQINPYALLTGYKTLYKASLAKSKLSGTYAVKLTPVSKQNPVSAAVLYIRAADWQPVRLDLADRQKNTVTVIITSIKTNQKLTSGDFTFPKNKYPKAEIIDLR